MSIVTWAHIGLSSFLLFLRVIRVTLNKGFIFNTSSLNLTPLWEMATVLEDQLHKCLLASVFPFIPIWIYWLTMEQILECKSENKRWERCTSMRVLFLQGFIVAVAMVRCCKNSLKQHYVQHDQCDKYEDFCWKGP